MKKNLIADFVQERRRAAGLTQIEMAAKAGVGLRFIRNLEQGKTTLRTDTVNKALFLFGKCLGVTDLIKEEAKTPLIRVMEFLDRKIQEARLIKADITPNNLRSQLELFKEWKEKVARAIDIMFAPRGEISERTKFYRYHPLHAPAFYVERMGANPNDGLGNAIDIHIKLLENLKKSKKSAHLKPGFDPDHLAEYD